MTRDRRHLRLIKSGRSGRRGFTIAPYHSPPFPVQGLVLEEDTWFALSTPPEVRDPREHPIRVMTDAWEARPACPGSVHIRGTYPFRLLAVVHDLSRVPTWRVDWIDEALRRSLEIAHQKNLTALAIEPLGTVHGRFELGDFDALLERVVSEDSGARLDLWRIDLRR